MTVPRDLAPALTQAARSFTAITLAKPRQSAKSTLCRDLFGHHRCQLAMTFLLIGTGTRRGRGGRVASGEGIGRMTR